MKRIRIVADDTIPYLKGVFESVSSVEIKYLPARGFTAESVRDADVLFVRSIDKCTKDLLAGSSVRLIVTATIGFDHIDTTFCDENGIAWKNAPGCNASSVGMYVLSSLIALSLKNGKPLCGMTIGIVGVGHVGSEVERLCTAMGLRVLRCDPPRAELEGPDGFVPLQVLLEQSDIITLHVPYTKEGEYATHHLADFRFFARLKKSPCFINSCRGAVHCTEALKDAYKNGLVSSIILDCWEKEPVIDQDLLEFSFLASPHIAGFSADGKANGTRMCVQAIADFFGLDVSVGSIFPVSPENPYIDLDKWTEHRIEHAVLSVYNPQQIDKMLRANPSDFEYLRNHYNHPREFPAYTVLNATAEERAVLHKLGFENVP